METFHLLYTDTERPEAMNNPFGYTAHPLCVEAAALVREHLRELPSWADEVAAGKMFGVLICEDGEGRLGFLAAYSGQIGGREDWPWFVPAVFDYLQPDGFFKQEEQAISAINRQVEQLENSGDYVQATTELAHVRVEAAREIADYRTEMQQAKARRDVLRTNGAIREEELQRESQFQKAELRRLKARWHEREASSLVVAGRLTAAVEALRQERRRRSDALQRWLFDRFVMVNGQGERRSLTDIFAATTQRVPPSGAGECCAPKLLQWAYTHKLRPLQIAEFWLGRSPRMEIRHEGCYYPACRGKCKPILEWMMGEAGGPGASGDTGISGDTEASGTTGTSGETGGIRLLFADSAVAVVNKPSGLLSVPGKSGAASVESLLRQRFGEVYMVHRLDMDTSGLLVVALTTSAYHHLQRQFLERHVYKKYIALLDGVLPLGTQGTISLPLRPDLDDRPRQLVDHVYGREAVSHYEVLAVENGLSRVALEPHTGRTHQLRMHCAHEEGLGVPIVGDVLYGRPAQRLCLHAAVLSFRHPLTGEQLTFESAPPF